ncbi:uncharacterized protein LOC132630976 [Lycium barbarum]|uniref:uncharacterized protein LOC132630976 n=1 Tax=Lycium barbarum TaxID=112863 RepID=UPI00293E0DE4|nr:uncharacterized protein LOC132630976 [Lycium barbarum]
MALPKQLEVGSSAKDVVDKEAIERVSVNSQQAFHRVQMLHRHHKFSIIALMEPFQHFRDIQRFRRRLGMRYAHHNCNGKTWFFINDNIDVEVIQDTDQQITVKLSFQEDNKILMTTMIYAKCEALERINLWDNLYNLADQMKVPWLVGRDFNVNMNKDEKIGGLPVYPYEYEDFAFCVNSCELFEVPFKESLFTWWNGRAEAVNQGCKTDFEADELITFKLKLKKVKSVLSEWSKATFGDIFKKLVVREDIVRVKEQLFEDDPSLANRMVLQLAQAELKKYMHYEEEFWRKKSHFTCFSEGDRNTRFFHNMVKGENQILTSMPTLEDVKNAVFYLSGDSSGGPDGMIGAFYQVCWEIMGANVYNVVKVFFEGQTLPKSITHTNLVLIPKKNNVETFADMRNISLSNFINKVISRVVQNKIENVLSSLISANQSGFVKGRCIIEDLLLIQEVVSDIRLRGKPANVVLKLDMAKAYDRVSWDFLARVPRKMGFAEVFIDMIWRLIANNWHSVLFNGQASVFFHSTKGVKQRDAISHALFMLSAKVLSRASNYLFEENGFRSYGMPKWSANLNRLAYADDTIIFSSADDTSLQLIMGIL